MKEYKYFMVEFDKVQNTLDEMAKKGYILTTASVYPDWHEIALFFERNVPDEE